MARPGDDLAALKRVQLFGSDIQASRPGGGAVPRRRRPHRRAAMIGRARLSSHISAAPGW